MDEDAEPENIDPTPVGTRLRAAREEKQLTLEEIAGQTRIPRRHLESLEAGDWDKLPAQTYTIGFAKSYASVVGLDRSEVADQLREEMGGHRPETAANEVFQPVDPARTMPRWLVLGAIVAVILLVLAMSWYGNRSLEGGDPDPVATEADEAPDGAPATPAEAPAEPVAEGPVVITAEDPAWVRITERDGRTLFEGMLSAGQSYQVPDTATAPLLRAGKPEALRITVGTATAPPIGPPATIVSDVSLLGPDLLRGEGQGGVGSPGQ